MSSEPLPSPALGSDLWNLYGNFLVSDDLFDDVEWDVDNGRKVAVYPLLERVARFGVLSRFQQEKIIARGNYGASYSLALNDHLDPSLQGVLWEWSVEYNKAASLKCRIGDLLAKRDDLEPDLARRFADDKSWDMLSYVLANRQTPVDVLERFLDYPEAYLRQSLASNPALSADMQVKLSFDEGVRKTLAVNPGLVPSAAMSVQFLLRCEEGVWEGLTLGADREAVDALKGQWVGSLAELLDACVLVSR